MPLTERNPEMITLIALAIVGGLIFTGEGEAAATVLGLVGVWWFLSAII